MKLTLDDKLKIIKLYEEGYTIPKLAKKFKVIECTIYKIERQYREHGIDSFKVKRKNSYYSPEFKYEIVQRVLNGESGSSIAAEMAVNDGMIFSWVKKYNELGYNGLERKQGRPPKMKPNDVKNIESNESALSNDEKDKEIKELKERNKQLEMENDLLKKLNVLVQQREKQQRKKK